MSPTRVGGRYVLLDELGRGGMATVHRAHDEVLDRQVAVKILHPHLAADTAFLDRFRREARAAAALSHPNVVGVHDWGETEEGAYLVLQLVEGPTLRQLLREHGQLTPEEAAGVLIPVARGLGAAHAAGMVHRDVKPENLLLGRDGIVRVTDFGLARAIASANATFGTDVLIGSPHYLAPEAVEGDPLDPRADVYSLGIILFECLTGAPPHSADTAFATAMRHTTHTVPPPSSLVDGIEPGVDDVVRWATAIHRGTRYPTGDDLARALGVAVPQVAPPMALDTGIPYDETARGAGAPIPIHPDDERGTDDQLWDGEQNASDDQDDETGPPPPPHRAAAASTQVVEQDWHEDDWSEQDWQELPEGQDSAHDETDEDEHTDVVGVWRRRSGWTVTLVIVGLILASGVGGYLLWDRLVAPVLPIPDVQGSAEDEALERLTAEGFEVEVAGRRHDLDRPEGTVLEQQPDGEARRGSEIFLVLSAGPRQVEVADVLGEADADAVDALEELGFEVEREERHDEDAPEGTVVEVTPEAGSLADEASSVTVTISLGPTPIEVPSLAGEPLGDATATVEELGLEIETVDRRYHDEVPEGHVIGQEPEAGSALLPGEVVEVSVSDGPQPIEVPSVRNEHVDDAVDELRALGFEVEVDRRGGIGAILQPGRVIDQNPSPGAQRLPGWTITLFAYED